MHCKMQSKFNWLCPKPIEETTQQTKMFHGFAGIGSRKYFRAVVESILQQQDEEKTIACFTWQQYETTRPQSCNALLIWRLLLELKRNPKP